MRSENKRTFHFRPLGGGDLRARAKIYNFEQVFRTDAFRRPEKGKQYGKKINKNTRNSEMTGSKLIYNLNGSLIAVNRVNDEDAAHKK